MLKLKGVGMRFRNWKLFGEYYKVCSSESYKETVNATEHLARECLLLLHTKAEPERNEILQQAQQLSTTLSMFVAEERPLIGALALLSAVRIHEELIRQHARGGS